MLIVIALGGNALLQRKEPQTIANQRKNLEIACKSIAKLSKKHTIILTHGNGPQVGLLTLMQKDSPLAHPLDVLGAETQGMIGYMLNQELQKLLPEKKIANILTMNVIDKNDENLNHYSKFIGPICSEKEVNELTTSFGWIFKKDNEHYRRVVPSPKPFKILQLDAILTLIKNDYLVICNGGGGIPVLDGDFTGVEAVIDKDISSAFLAEKINADKFIVLTDVSAVRKDFKDENTSISIISPEELEKINFPEGSMLPKVQACCEFVKNTKKTAHIGSLDNVQDILNGNSGTTIKINN